MIRNGSQKNDTRAARDKEGKTGNHFPRSRHLWFQRIFNLKGDPLWFIFEATWGFKNGVCFSTADLTDD